MKFNYLLFLFFVSTIIYASVEFSTGITETTRLNGQGCVCHNLTPDSSVHVWIEGPDTLLKGETAEYHIFLTGGAMVKGGFNIASRFSTLAATDPGTQIIAGELTHNQPRLFAGDTISWFFNYTASDSVDWDTLYSDANSVNGNGIPDTGDKWNFGPNFPVRLIDNVPVELTSLNAVNSNGTILLNWTTATEQNNKGFEVERKGSSKQPDKVEVSPKGGKSVSSGWEKIGFVEGFGTSTEPKCYNFIDKNIDEGKYDYRLKQIDFDGNFKYSIEVEITVNVPSKYSLEQNYPNPFNPTTNISFSIGKPSLVTLKVYNILGKEVAVLMNEYKNPGTYNLRFDGTDLPSGVYIYTLTSGSFSTSKKLLLLK